MKNRLPQAVENSRITKGPLGSDRQHGLSGAFGIKYKKVTLFVIASNEFGWDHVSVSLPHRTPSWNEMNHVKDLFFEENETVVQFHPKKSEYVNFHPHVLHLWKKHGLEYELPPKFFV